jgi:uncharacterized protein
LLHNPLPKILKHFLYIILFAIITNVSAISSANSSPYFNFNNDTIKNVHGSYTEIKVMFQNGKPKEVVRLKNNRKHGLQQQYNTSGTIRSETNYNNGLLCGNYITYNNDGAIIEKKTYRCNVSKNKSWLDGKYEEYQGKTLITKGLYKDSLKEGKWLQYHNNGVLKSEQNYKKGLLFGEQKFYNNNGALNYKSNQIETIENGKKISVKHGKFVSYHQNGKLREEGVYEMDKKSGLWHEYNQNGDLYRETFYKNGKVHGINNSYTNTGKPETKSEYYEEIEIDGKKIKNVFHGIRERYRDNGKIDSREKYIYGKKEGTWETYYTNGNIRETNTYKNNLQIGKSIGYDEEGNMIYDANFEIIKGDSIDISVKTGTEKRWKNKVLVFETTYKNGKENGIRKSYFPSGKLSQIQNFVDDLLQGESIEYYENGNIKSKRNYNSFVTASKEKKFNQTGWVFQYDDDGILSTKLFFDSLGNRIIQYSYHNGKLNQIYIDKVLELNYFPDGKFMSEKIMTTQYGPFSRYYFMNGNIRKISFQNAENLIYNTLHFKSDGAFIYASGSFYNKPDTLLPPQYLISSMINAAGGKFKANKFHNDSIKNGNYTINYSNGKLYAKMNFNNDLPNGDFVFYHPETNDTMLYAKFNNGLLNGAWLEKYGGKHVYQRGEYCFQKMCGTWVRNQTSGKPYEIRRYNSKTGQSGAITEFYPSGNFKSFSDYDSGAYEYRDDKGNITSRSIVIDETNKIVESETYYIGKNILKSRNIYKNKVQDGVAETYYESGKLQSKMPYVNGKRNGTYYEYFENGALKRKTNWQDDKLEGMGIVVNENGKIDTLYYRNNNLQVKPPSVSCACIDTTHSTNRRGFAPLLNHLLEYDLLQSYIPKYLIPVDSLNYRSIFYTGFQNSNGHNAGFGSLNLMMFKEFAFYLPSDKQIKLVFNPCITKGYVSRMEVSANYGIGNRNYTNVDFYPKKIALEFMKGPVKSNDKNHPNFKALFDAKNVNFNPDKKIEIKTKNPENNCFTAVIINKLLEINVQRGEAYIFEKFNTSVFDKYQLKMSQAELDLFFGIVAAEVKVKFEIYGSKGYETIEANSDFMMLGGEYACGVVKINCSKDENEVYTTLNNQNKFIVTDIRKALESKGFSRINFTYSVADKQLWFSFFTP